MAQVRYEEKKTEKPLPRNFSSPTQNTELGVYVASKYWRYWSQGRRQATKDANLEYHALIPEMAQKFTTSV